MSAPHRCSWLGRRRRQEKARRRLANTRYRGRRTDLPRRIERPLDLSDFDQFFTEEWLLDTLEAQHFWPLIEDATRIQRPEGAVGRPALDGSWALWMPLFVFTKHLSMTAFLKEAEAKEWWRRLGFRWLPSHGAFWDTVKRLETEAPGVYADAAWFVLRRIDRHLEGDVLRDWWWDCTLARSPSRWYHCCDDAECPKKRIATDRKAARQKRGRPQRPLTPEQIKRAKELPDDPDADDGDVTSDARGMPSPGEEEPDDDLKPKAGGVPNLPSLESIVRRLYGAEEADRIKAGLDPDGFRRPTRSPILLARDRLDAFRAVQGLRPSHRDASEHYDDLVNHYDGPGRYFSLKSTGCLYWTCDKEAAVRRKSDHRRDEAKKRDGQHGQDGEQGEDTQGKSKQRFDPAGEAPVLAYDVSRLVSWGAGTVLGVLVASDAEHRLYRPTLEAALARAPYKPRAIVTDATGGLKPVSDVSAEAGIGHVSPSFGYGYANNDKWVDDPHGRWDRYGIPRCKHCGAPCRYRKARAYHGPNGECRWRLFFRCAIPQGEKCHQSQSLYVDEDTRILTTIWRDRPVWHALKRGRGPVERAHNLERRRFFLTSDHHIGRRGRKGVAFQQLLGEVAMLITALKMAFIHGILDGLRRIPKAVTVATGEAGMKRFIREYRRARLNICRPDFVEARRAYEASRVRRSPNKSAPEQLE